MGKMEMLIGEIIDEQVYLPPDHKYRQNLPGVLVHFWATYMGDGVQFGGGWEDIPAWQTETKPTELEIYQYVERYQKSVYGDLRRFENFSASAKRVDGDKK
jgi:hypothetical protein